MLQGSSKKFDIDFKEKAFDTFLPLKIRKLPPFLLQGNENVDIMVISNNKKYVCLNTYPGLPQEIQTLKLYDLESQQLQKVIEEKQCYYLCEFSQDSSVIIFMNKKCCIIYQIKEQKEVTILKENAEVKFSFDSSQYLCFSEGQIQFFQFPDVKLSSFQTQNNKWQFSLQQNYYLSCFKDQDLLQIQYYRNQKQRLHRVKNIYHFSKDYYFMNQVQLQELFMSRLIVIYSLSVIKLYALYGKLIRTIKLNIQSYQTIKIQMRNDINNKAVIIAVFQPSYKSCTEPYKKVGFLSLLPKIMTQICVVTNQENLVAKRLDPLHILLKDVEKKQIQICQVE